MENADLRLWNPPPDPPTGVFMHVRLESNTGELVTYGEIPAFSPPPDVLLWGDRVFRYHSSDAEAHYRECFAVALARVLDDKAGARP